MSEQRDKCDQCAGCEYKRRAWTAEGQLEIRYGLRREIAAALHSSDATGDEALRQGLETIKRMRERAARWKAAAKRLRKRQKDEQSFDDVCATEEYLFEDPT